MIITCPHCQTKYQVAYEAIGSAGRKVQCAHCHQAWDQRPGSFKRPAPAAGQPEADRLFTSMAEDALDEAMLSEEHAMIAEKTKFAPAASPAGKDGAPREPVETPSLRAPNAAEVKKRQADFSKRQSAMISRLPLARLRRAARIAGMVTLASLAVTAYFGRVDLVRHYPDLAGLYDAVGLGVNVVGLDFSNLETLKTLSGGNDILVVSAQIVGLSREPIGVPPVVVSLLDGEGKAVYEWSVTPRVRDLMAGERATFDTRLSLPPSEAARVRLSFARSNGPQAERNGSGRTAPPVPE